MVAFVVLGSVTVLAAVMDAALTVLHPTRRGALSWISERTAFAVVRRGALAVGRPGLMTGAAPLAMLASVSTWVMLAWVGFALVYLPYMDQLYYTSGVSYGDQDLWEALYFSGTALTTVGFGDIVAETEPLRILSILQAAIGFGIFTAAITYVLSVYPRVARLRSAARTVSNQAFDAEQAARLVLHGGPAYLTSVQDGLLEIDEQTQLFPILYFFPGDRNSSLYTLMRGCCMLALQGRWGVSADAAPHAPVFGQELQQAVERTAHHYAIRFTIGGGPDFDQPLDAHDAGERLTTLRAAAGDQRQVASAADDPHRAPAPWRWAAASSPAAATRSRLAARPPAAARRPRRASRKSPPTSCPARSPWRRSWPTPSSTPASRSP